MKIHACLSLLSLASLVSLAHADVTIVDENFDNYTQATFNEQWNPDLGDGRFDLTGFGDTGRVVPDPGNSALDPPNDNPPGIMGQGIAMTSNINEYNNTANPGDPDDPAFELVPTATQAVRFGADLFDDSSSAVPNKKLTVAMRNDTVQRDPVGDPSLYGTNFIEIGLWNATTFDPIDPANAPPNDPVFDVPATDFGYRAQLVGGVGGDLVRQPDWQYFSLDPSLDIDDMDLDTTEPTPDGFVSSVDIGPGWHRWEATITTTTITYTLDLFRDGVKNLTRDGNGDLQPGVGDPGFDAEVTWEITLNNFNQEDEFDFDPLTSLRFGVPSGSGGGVTNAVIDNVKLELVDIVPGMDDADFDGDGDVDGEDFLAWQRGHGISDGSAQPADGDANGDGNVDGVDLAAWEAQYGNGGLSAPLASIPEPGAASLMLLAICSRLLSRGRRS